VCALQDETNALAQVLDGDLREMTRAVNELDEMARAVDPVGEMSRQIRDAQAVYRAAETLDAMKPLIHEAVSLAAQIPESALERTLDRTQRDAFETARRELEARRRLIPRDILRANGW